MSIFTIAATIIVGGLMISGLSFALDIEPLRIMIGSVGIGGVWFAYEVITE
jgi:hypothetical protein